MITITASGFLGEKPILQFVSKEHRKVEFDVISPRRVYRDGEWETVWERATFVAWDAEAEKVCMQLDKGSDVVCTGLQMTDDWVDRDQQKRRSIKYSLTAWEKRFSRAPQGNQSQDGGRQPNDRGHTGGEDQRQQSHSYRTAASNRAESRGQPRSEQGRQEGGGDPPQWRDDEPHQHVPQTRQRINM